jgi:hypothetical protein
MNVADKTTVKGRTGRHREKAWCPTCQQWKNAVWRRLAPDTEPVLLFHNHRKQHQLQPGEKPLRCANSGGVAVLDQPDTAQAQA